MRSLKKKTLPSFFLNRLRKKANKKEEEETDQKSKQPIKIQFLTDQSKGKENQKFKR